MSKTVSVVCNVLNALPGSTNNDANFNIDWACILKANTPYYVSFTYIGGINNYGIGERPPSVFVNFPSLAYRLARPNQAPYTSTVNFSYQSIDFLGLLEPINVQPTTNSVYLTATSDTNGPSYIESRPKNNLFNVKIVRENVSTLLWTDYSNQPPSNWILTLYFKEAITPLYKVPKKITKLVLSTSWGYTGSNSNYTFALGGLFDRNKEYKVSFTFSAGKPLAGNNGQPILVFLNFNNDAYVPSSTPFLFTSKSGYIGFISRIRFDTGIDSCYLASNSLTNEPVNTVMNYQGFLNVRFLNLDLTETTYLNNLWVLALSLEEVY